MKRYKVQIMKIEKGEKSREFIELLVTANPNKAVREFNEAIKYLKQNKDKYTYEISLLDMEKQIILDLEYIESEN